MAYHSDSLLEMVLGEKLGAGSCRTTYVNNLNPQQVIKYEADPQDRHQNVIEWQVWNTAQDFGALSRWLAPCYNISPDGRYLVMARVEPLTKRELPKQVPAWMCDLKLQNFGRYKGKIVACDYGTSLAMWLSETKGLRRMKRAVWGSDRADTHDPLAGERRNK